MFSIGKDNLLNERKNNSILLLKVMLLYHNSDITISFQHPYQLFNNISGDFSWSIVIDLRGIQSAMCASYCTNNLHFSSLFLSCFQNWILNVLHQCHSWWIQVCSLIFNDIWLTSHFSYASGYIFLSKSSVIRLKENT